MADSSCNLGTWTIFTSVLSNTYKVIHNSLTFFFPENTSRKNSVVHSSYGGR